MTENKHLVPACIIYMDGVRINQKLEGAIRSVRVVDILNKVGECTVTFDYTDLSNEDTTAFPYDVRLSVLMGYKDDMNEVFDGEITKIAIDHNEGSSLFSVTAMPCFQRLGHGSHNRSYENKTPSQIIKDILSRYDLQAECDSFGVEIPYWNQRDKSDMDAVLYLAKRYGKEVSCYGDKVYVKERMTHRKDEVIFEWGKSLIKFDAKVSIEEQTDEIKVIGWDTLSGKSVTDGAKISDVEQKSGGDKDWTKASKGGGGKWGGAIYDPSVSDAAEARELGKAIMREKSFKLLKAEGSSEGNSLLGAGMPVMVKYVGPYSGEYIAETVIHRFDIMLGYMTEFYLKRNMLEEGFKKTSGGSGAAAGAGASGQGGTGGDDSVTESQSDDEEETEEEEEDGPEFRGLVWKDEDGKEIDEALVDDEVTLFCEVKNIDDGETVKFKIFEQGKTKYDDIAEVEGSIADGKVEAQWKVVFKADKDSQTAEELEEQGYTTPDYYFYAEYNGVESGESKRLDAKNMIHKRLIDKKTNKILSNKKYIITLIDGKRIQGTSDGDGYMKAIETNHFTKIKKIDIGDE